MEEIKCPINTIFDTWENLELNIHHLYIKIGDKLANRTTAAYKISSRLAVQDRKPKKIEISFSDFYHLAAEELCHSKLIASYKTSLPLETVLFLKPKEEQFLENTNNLVSQITYLNGLLSKKEITISGNEGYMLGSYLESQGIEESFISVLLALVMRSNCGPQVNIQIRNLEQKIKSELQYHTKFSEVFNESKKNMPKDYSLNTFISYLKAQQFQNNISELNSLSIDIN